MNLCFMTMHVCNPRHMPLLTQSTYHPTQLDHDESGFVSLKELRALIEKQAIESPICKRFLTAASFSRSSKGEALLELDTNSWNLEAKTVEELRERIQTQLLMASASVRDFYVAITNKGRIRLDKKAFIQLMVGIGYQGDTNLLTQLFREVDDDGSGELGLDEVRTFPFHPVKCMCTICTHTVPWSKTFRACARRSTRG